MVALLLIGMATILGPRIIDIVYWLFARDAWQAAFGDSLLWPILGILVLPWVTLAYVIVSPEGVTGLDWVVLIVALFADVGTYGGNAYKGRSTFASNA